MNIESTISKLNEMKIFGMAKSYCQRRSQPDHQELSYDEFFALVVDDEYIYRKNKRQTRLMQRAKFKISSACIEEIDYRQPRGLQKTSIINLQNTRWLESHQNILITGPTGVGKTYIACAFGTWACRNGFTALYYRWARLCGDFNAGRGDGSYLKVLSKISKSNLLVIDDFGLSSMSDNDRKDFLEVIEERYMTGSTVIASQLPVKDWYEFIGDPTIADAVMDRILHQSYKFELKGGSMRKKQKELD